MPIVLVKADGNEYLSNPKAAFSKNHQVLAIGYRRHGDEWGIDIYDPNFPNTIQTLHTGGRYQTPKGDTTRTGSFRGYFRTPYKLERPPWVPDTPSVIEGHTGAKNSAHDARLGSQTAGGAEHEA